MRIIEFEQLEAFSLIWIAFLVVKQPLDNPALSIDCINCEYKKKSKLLLIINYLNETLLS